MEIKKAPSTSGIVVLEMTGRILMGPDCKKMEEEVERLIQENETRVIFDVTGVYQVDSAGLGRIVACFTKLKKAGGLLRLAGVKGMLEGVLKITQVHRVIGIYPSVAEASENFPPAEKAVPGGAPPRSGD